MGPKQWKQRDTEELLINFRKFGRENSFKGRVLERKKWSKSTVTSRLLS